MQPGKQSKKRPKLKRALGLFETTIFGVGIILGAGIYALIGPAAGMAGNSMWMAFVVAAVIASFTGLSYAELSTMYPKEAAEYVYVKNASKSSTLAFLIGWLIIVTEVIAASAVALGFAGYFTNLFSLPSYYLILSGLALIGMMSFVNFWGIKESSGMNMIFTGIEVFGLLLIICLGMLFGNFHKNLFAGPTGVFDFKAVFAAAGLIFFAYIGFEDIVNISEETKKPKKILPRAIILAVIITTIVYILTSMSTIFLAEPSELASTDAPLALTASKTPLGLGASFAMSIIALFATGNTVLIILIVGSRMIYGMASDGALPKKLARIHPKRRTPWLAVLLVMIFSMVFIFFKDIEIVASATSLAALLTFAMVNWSLIWLRHTKPRMKRPFKAPLNIGNHSIIPFLGLASCMAIIMHFDKFILAFGFALIFVGYLIYKLYIEK